MTVRPRRQCLGAQMRVGAFPPALQLLGPRPAMQLHSGKSRGSESGCLGERPAPLICSLLASRTGDGRPRLSRERRRCSVTAPCRGGDQASHVVGPWELHPFALIILTGGLPVAPGTLRGGAGWSSCAGPLGSCHGRSGASRRGGGSRTMRTQCVSCSALAASFCGAHRGSVAVKLHGSTPLKQC